QDLLVAVEYGRWFTMVSSTNPSVVPVNPGDFTDRGYAMLSYRFTTWFAPAVYYSVLRFIGSPVRTGLAAYQHRGARTVRFHIHPAGLVKLEAHFMAGTGGLSPVLDGGRLPETLAPIWGAFFVKTTAHF